jgi:hypothetical protein
MIEVRRSMLPTMPNAIALFARSNRDDNIFIQRLGPELLQAPVLRASVDLGRAVWLKPGG